MITLNEIEEALYGLLRAGRNQGFNDSYENEMRKASQAFTQLAELREKYVLVPREPTKELCEAIGVAIDGDLPLVDILARAARSYAALQKLASEIGKLVEVGERCRSYKLHKDPDIKDYEYLEIGEFECPMCEGQGTVDGEQHVNVRGEVSAMNVLFSGIGQDMVDWAEFHKTAIEARPTLKAIHDNLTKFGKDTSHE